MEMDYERNLNYLEPVDPSSQGDLVQVYEGIVQLVMKA